MNRTELRTFLRTGVDAITPVTEFGSGEISDFNSDRSHVYPSVWQNIKPVSPDLASNGAPTDTWDVELIIAQKDAIDSNPEQYEDIIDKADLIAQKLIYQYRNVTDGYKLVMLTSITRTPFVKKHADCLSGVTLTFKVIAQDKTNVC